MGITSPTNADEAAGTLFSCWGCLKLKLPWTTRRRTRRGYTSAIRLRSSRGTEGFRYDPLSYAQNFDEGFDEDDQEFSQRGFSARYAAPASLSKSPVEDK